MNNKHYDSTLDTYVSMLPEHMQNSAKNYVLTGCPPGSFLSYILQDSLTKAVAHADNVNRAYLVEWAQFLYNAVPTAAWGNAENVGNWIKTGGLHGQRERSERERNEENSNAGQHGWW